MKNQIHQAWICQSVMATLLFVSVGVGQAFAKESDCENPSELTLEGLDGQIKMKFCGIPAAEGVDIGSDNRLNNERPVKARNFSKFQMAQFEVTQLQYKTVTGLEPWKRNGGNVQESSDNPAVYVSHSAAQQFARILSLSDKTATYRLPTEAEFEYAARAGTTTNYYWGDEYHDAGAFTYFWGNTSDGVGGQYGRKVDSCPDLLRNSNEPGYCANNFGLYHMLGNVQEWTADDYVDNYENAPIDGNVAVKSEVTPGHVVRGASWHVHARGLRSTERHYADPSEFRFGASFVGFRVVRIAK